MKSIAINLHFFIFGALMLKIQALPNPKAQYDYYYEYSSDDGYGSNNDGYGSNQGK